MLLWDDILCAEIILEVISNYMEGCIKLSQIMISSIFILHEGNFERKDACYYYTQHVMIWLIGWCGTITYLECRHLITCMTLTNDRFTISKLLDHSDEVKQGKERKLYSNGLDTMLQSKRGIKVKAVRSV